MPGRALALPLALALVLVLVVVLALPLALVLVLAVLLRGFLHGLRIRSATSLILSSWRRPGALSRALTLTPG